MPAARIGALPHAWTSVNGMIFSAGWLERQALALVAAGCARPRRYVVTDL